jgi:hypothetical protein
LGFGAVLFRNKIEVVNRQMQIRVKVAGARFFGCGVLYMQPSTGTKPQKSSPEKPYAQKLYEPPGLKKLTPNQAEKLLLDHSSRGDQGAEDILDLVRVSGKEIK